MSHTWWETGAKPEALPSPGPSGTECLGLSGTRGARPCPPAGPTHNDGAVGRAAIELAPLDAEGQHNAIMALQRLLALVGGTRVPHLQKPGSGQIPAGPARWQGHYCTNDVSTGEQRKPCPRAGAGRGWCAVPSPAAPGCLAPGQAATHLDGLVRGPTEEQVPHGVDAETPDGALVAHKCSLALEDLLWVVGCRETGGMRCLGAWGPRGGQQGAHTHSRGCPCSAAR